MSTPSPIPDGTPRFETTSWTLIVDAGGAGDDRSQRALSTLLERYWLPLYAWARRRGTNPDDAKDLVQGFFARFLEKDAIEEASPERGRFRTFLLACFDHFVTNEWNKEQAQKRGGGRSPLSLDFDTAESHTSIDPSHHRTPEREFERRWAMTVLDRALARVADEFTDDGREDEFEVLRPFLTGDASRGDSSAAAQSLGKTAGAFKVAVHRLRQRYGEALRSEVGETLSSPDDLDDEVDHLLAALRAPE